MYVWFTLNTEQVMLGLPILNLSNINDFFTKLSQRVVPEHDNLTWQRIVQFSWPNIRGHSCQDPSKPQRQGRRKWGGKEEEEEENGEEKEEEEEEVENGEEPEEEEENKGLKKRMMMNTKIAN